MENRIIIPLDVDYINALNIAKTLDPKICRLKVGNQLFTSSGPQVINDLKELGFEIFLDLKFHDIPNTMSSACYQVSKLGVDIISVHASAGLKALKDSKKASLEGSRLANVKPPFVVGVTVLTSFSLKDFQTDLDRNNSIEDNVLRLAKLSFDAGLDGCVCSPLEVRKLRSIYKNNFELITPGIRKKIENKDDQNRIMTPNEAIYNGASKLVIGRSISKAIDPNKALIEIFESIDSD